MTIIEFYKSLSNLLTDTREEFLSQNQSKKKLEQLLEKAKESGLNINISENILDPINLMRLDDENSFRSEDNDHDDGDWSFGYDSSF
jgi:hypothetical protein